MERSVFFKATYLFVLCISLTAASLCRPNMYPEFRQYVQYGPELPDPSYTLTSYTFPCHGRIIRWEVYTSDDGGHQIEFQVWRPQTSKGQYKLIGTNSFQNALPIGDTLRLTVATSNRIEINPGDIVGIRTEAYLGTDDDDGFEIQTVVNESPGAMSFNLTGLSYTIGGVLSLNDTRSRELNFDPVMDVLVDETASQSQSDVPTTQTAGRPTTTQPSVPLYTIIAIAVAAGLLLALVTLFIITLILVCYCMGKSKSQNPPVTQGNNPPVTQENRPPITQEHLDYNMAYCPGTNWTEEQFILSSNKAYTPNRATDVNIVKNVSYSQNGDFNVTPYEREDIQMTQNRAYGEDSLRQQQQQQQHVQQQQQQVQTVNNSVHINDPAKHIQLSYNSAYNGGDGNTDRSTGPYYSSIRDN